MKMIKRNSYNRYKLKIFAGIISLLLFCEYSFAQSESTKLLQQQVNDYQKTIPQEKIFAHLDKGFYLAGEILWFKLYLTDASSHQLLDLSKVAYVEILSNDRKPAAAGKDPA